MPNPNTDPASGADPARANSEPPMSESPRAAATPHDATATPPGDETPLFPTMPNLPDMRRDAIEEAAETSSEARARVSRMNDDEATADPTLSRPSDAA
jgi:hypothetical protein